MSLALTAPARPAPRVRARRRRRWTKAAAAALGVGLLIWTLLPVYNMVLIALDSDADEFTGSIWPPDPDLSSFQSVWTEDYWLLEHFWQRFGNSIYMGVATMALTVLIGSLTSYSLGTDAATQRVDGHRLNAAHLCAANDVPGHSVRARHASVRDDGRSVGGDRRDGCGCHALCDPDLSPIWQTDSDGVGQVGEDRRCVALANLHTHLTCH